MYLLLITPFVIAVDVPKVLPSLPSYLRGVCPIAIAVFVPLGPERW